MIMTRIDVKMLNSKELRDLKNMINDELNFRDSIGKEIDINEIHIKEINELQQQNYDVWLSADEWSKRRVGEEDDNGRTQE